MSKTEEKQTVVFYHWLDQSPQSTPSGVKGIPGSMTVRVRGGEIHRDKNSAAYATEYREVKFLKGKLEVGADDIEVIETIRELAKHDRTITEDESVYLAHVAEPASKVKLQAQTAELKTANADLRKKNAELAEKLAGLKKLAAAEDKLAEVVGAKPAAA
jgi:hypothetical protein